MNAAEARALRGLMRFTLVYIPRTHFDLAWWMIMSVFQGRFEPVMTELVNVLETEPWLKFTLDGQVVLAEWWVQYPIDPQERAERARRVQVLVERGQLQVGPSLVLPDAFLTPGEAQIWNELMGRRISMAYGAPQVQVIDHSDVFGAPAQKAQILAAFAKYYYYTRGQAKSDIAHPAVFWESPSGEGIIAVAHPGGYSGGYEFGRKSRELSLLTVHNFLNNYEERFAEAGIPFLMMCGGGDHTELGNRIQEDLAAAARDYPQVEFAIGTDNDYAQMLNLDPAALPVRRGEFCRSGRENLLRGVNSTRLELKQRNEEIYRQLAQAQTLVSLNALRDGAQTRHWRLILDRCRYDFLILQSHDAITGCHVDDVSANINDWYDRIEQQVQMVMQQAMAHLANAEYAMAYRNRCGLAPAAAFSLWNPLPYFREEVVVVDLPEELQGDFRLSARINGLPAQVQRLDAARAAVMVTTGSFEAAQIELESGAPGGPKALCVTRTIRNEHLSVQVMPNGTLNVLDWASGCKFSGLGWLASQGDRGDEYDANLVADRLSDSRSVTADVRVLCSGPLVQELEVTYGFEVPARLDEARCHRTGRVTIPVKTVVRLRRGSRQVEFETTIVNAARDQLLRVVFPVGETVARSRAESVFMVQPYPVLPPTDPQWQENSTDFEPEFNTRANHGLVMAGQLVSFNRGLTEYEVYDTPTGSELALTLVRGVSHLSQEDLDTRRGGAGPVLPVPGAQGLGEHTFAYTLGFAGRATDIELAQAAQAWRNGFVTAPAGLDTAGILACQLGQTVFSALKPAEDGNGVVLRVWGGAEPSWIRIDGPRSRERLELDESAAAPGKHGTRVSKHEIASWRLS